MVYPSICLAELRKTTKNLSQDGQFPSHPLNITQECYHLSPLAGSKNGSQLPKKEMKSLLLLSMMQL
jgi:hypothetical protein